MGKRVLFFTALFLVLRGYDAYGWSHHHRLSQAILSGEPALQKKVKVTPFEELLPHSDVLLQDLAALKKMGVSDIEAYDPKLSFNENLKINKNYRFVPNAPSPVVSISDPVGAEVPLIDILSKYSDEPDWTMDQLLFTKDQYPEIYEKNPNYYFMGAKDNKDPVPTQAFRHMYWKEFCPFQRATFKIPTLNHLGEAPERAALFVAISLRAKELGQDYWAARFLANALHYLEDPSQPYHSSQNLGFDFWPLPFTDSVHGEKLPRLSLEDIFTFIKKFPAIFVTDETHILTYYHFNFEDYVARLMEKYVTSPSQFPEAREFFQALTPESKPIACPQRNVMAFSASMMNRVKKISSYAVKMAPKASSSSLEFFPHMPPQARFYTFDGEAIKKFMDDQYWADVFRRGAESTPAKAGYFGVVESMFKALAPQVRAVVDCEFGAQE